MSVYLSAVEAPQLISVVLTSFHDMFELSLQYDQQVCTSRSLVYIPWLHCLLLCVCIINHLLVNGINS